MPRYVIMLASHDQEISAPQDIHLKPNVSPVSGSLDYNCIISTLVELSILSIQLLMAQSLLKDYSLNYDIPMHKKSLKLLIDTLNDQP